MNERFQNVWLWLALALVPVTESVLFVECLYVRCHQHVLPWSWSSERGGEGLVIRNNGLGYYVWLRSLLIDHNWDFDNEFDEYGIPGEYVPPPSYRSETGRRANHWSVGPACVWAWSVVPGHFILKTSWLPWQANGYSLPYQLLVGITTLIISWTGLLFLYGICRCYARPQRSVLAVILLTLGSTIVYYSAVEVSMAHGLGTAALAALVWYWQKTYGSSRLRRWLMVGILLGVTALMRWQLITFALLPAGEIVLKRQRKFPVGLVLVALGALFVFLPQMIAWRCVYGHWLVAPVPQLARHWLHPSLWQILLSQDRSLFYWTPISLVACAGTVTLAFLPGQGPARVLLAAFAVQVYALASLWGKGDFLSYTGNYAGAFLSRAYGMRHLTESLVTLAPGLAWLLERASGLSFRVLAGLGSALAFWNLLLVLQYSYGLLPQFEGLGPSGLATTTRRFIENEPLTCLLLVEGLVLLWLLLVWNRETPTLHREGEKANGSQAALSAESDDGQHLSP